MRASEAACYDKRLLAPLGRLLLSKEHAPKRSRGWGHPQRTSTFTLPFLTPPPFLFRGLDRSTGHPQTPTLPFFLILHLASFPPALRHSSQTRPSEHLTPISRPVFSTPTPPGDPQKDPPSHSKPRDLDTFPSLGHSPTTDIKTHPWEPTLPSEGLGALGSPTQATSRITQHHHALGQQSLLSTHSHSLGETQTCVPLA